MAPKALVVDDDVIMLVLLEHILRQNDYEIRTATHGDKALRALEIETFDLVITDFEMGEISGLDVIQKAKCVNKETVVIMVTGCSDQRNQLNAFQQGADAVLLKPFSTQDLLESLNVGPKKNPPRLGREVLAEI